MKEQYIFHANLIAKKNYVIPVLNLFNALNF